MYDLGYAHCSFLFPKIVVSTLEVNYGTFFSNPHFNRLGVNPFTSIVANALLCVCSLRRDSDD